MLSASRNDDEDDTCGSFVVDLYINNMASLNVSKEPKEPEEAPHDEDDRAAEAAVQPASVSLPN